MCLPLPGLHSEDLDHRAQDTADPRVSWIVFCGINLKWSCDLSDTGEDTQPVDAPCEPAANSSFGGEAGLFLNAKLTCLDSKLGQDSPGPS